jgi:hypothetical protein
MKHWREGKKEGITKTKRGGKSRKEGPLFSFFAHVPK